MSVLRAIQTQHFELLKKRKDWKHVYYAFDLHGTIVKPNYEVGNIPKEFYPYAKEVLQMLSKRSDIIMYIYTCSHPHEQVQYLQYFKEHGIEFKWVNKNPEVLTDNKGYGYYEDKPYFNVLFEDKASFNPNTEWEEVYYYFKTLNSDINVRNEKLFNVFKEEHINDGGKLPQETALTNLINDCLIRRDYKVYNGGGYDIDKTPIKKYDVVLYRNLANDPYFMVALNVSEGDYCSLYRCNDNVKIEKIII